MSSNGFSFWMTRYYLRIYLKNSKNPSAYIIAFRYIYIYTYINPDIEKGEQNLTDALAVERGTLI